METKNTAIYQFLPKVNEEQIEDMYLYYSDELLDSYYSIYLNCSYFEKQYEAELERLSNIMSQYNDIIKKDSKSFSYESFCLDSVLEFDSNGNGIVDYTYFLFDSENKRIIYVMILEKEVSGESVNIPLEFLPSEVIELRSKF